MAMQSSIIVIAPLLLSSSPGTALILSLVNKQLRGEAAVDDLSLSWFGSIRVKNLRLLDPDGLEVLSVDRATVNMGLWQAIRAPQRFLQLTLDSPRVAFCEQKDGTFSLLEAIGPKKSPTSKSKEKRPDSKPSAAKKKKQGKESRPVQGRIIIQDGRVRLIRNNGHNLMVQDLAGDFDVKPSNRITGDARLRLASGGSLELGFNVRNVTAEGKSVPGASGTVTIRTSERVELGPILAVITGKSETTGRVSLGLEATIRSGDASIQYDAVIEELLSQANRRSGLGPLHLASRGKVLTGLTPLRIKEVAGDADLQGDGAQLATKVTYRHSPGEVLPTMDEIVAAALDGEAIDLPDVTLEANGSADLETLTQTVPALANVRQGLRVTGGYVFMDELFIRGGEMTQASGTVHLTGLSTIEIDPVTGEETERAFAPITAIVDAALIHNEGLKVWSAELQSEFASFQGSGDPKEMHLLARGNLAELSKHTGKFELALHLQADDPGISFEGDGNVSGWSFATRDAQYSTAEAIADWKGHYLPEQKTVTAEIGLATGEILASLTGKNGQHERLRIEPTELRTTLVRDSITDTLLSDGRATLGRIFLNGESPVENPVGLEWSSVEFSPKDNRLTAAEVRLDGEDLLTLWAKSGAVEFREEPQVECVFEVTADLARCLAAAQPFANWEEVPPLAGVVSWNGEAATAPDLISASGKISAQDLTVGSGERALRQDQIVLEHDTSLNLKKDSLRLGKLSLSSQPLSLDLSGTIEKLTTDFIMDLSGSYQASWDEVTPLLDNAAPRLRKEIGLALAGTSESDIRITGAANQPRLQPVFRGISTNKIRLDWTSAQIVGLNLGPPADLQPMLSDGKLILGATRIPLSSGALGLDGLLDFTEPTPAFRSEGQIQLIDKAEITREVGQRLLSRINPIFGQVSSVQGTFSLAVSDLYLPFGEEIRSAGAGSGRLDLEKVDLEPAGILGTLTRLGGILKEGPSAATFTALDFAMRDGKIVYDNLSVTFAGAFDLRFRGSVGFDDSVNMVVSVPVGPAVLKYLGAAGPVDRYARLLAKENVRIDIPIGGTRLAPILGAVNVGPLLKRTTEGLLKQGIRDAGGLLKLPFYLLTNPLEVLKTPGRLLKKPLELIKRPATLIQQPWTALQYLKVTPEQLLVDSLLDLLERQREAELKKKSQNK